LPVIAVTGMAFEARIARGEGVEVVYAARADLLERALSAAVARGCAGIISFGTAGGLAPDLAPGAVIIADAVEGPLGRFATDPRWSERLAAALAATPLGARLYRGLMAGVTAPLTGADDKAVLHRSSGALAVALLLPHTAYRSRCAARLSILRGARCLRRRRQVCATTAVPPLRRSSVNC
jgi:hypothetical protein